MSLSVYLETVPVPIPKELSRQTVQYRGRREEEVTPVGTLGVPGVL